MRRARVLGWIGFVVLVLAGLVWAAIVIRRGEDGETLEALIARHEREGRGTTVAGVLQREPALDADAQARFLAWREARRGDAFEYVEADPEAWFLDGQAQPPAAVRAQHEALRPAMDELVGILAGGRLRTSSLAWLRDALGGVEPTLQAIEGLRLPGGWDLLDATAWFQLEACCGDTEAALTALDRMHASLRPVGVALDAMFLMGVGSVRDRTYLVLALRGKLPPARAAAWLGEEPPTAEQLAEGYRGNRILYQLPLARALAAGDVAAGRRALLGGARSLWEHADREVYLRWSAAREGARSVDLLARVADYLRDPAALPALRATDAWRADAGPLLLEQVHGWHVLVDALVQHRTFHRAVRLAVRTLALRASGPLPATEAALRARLGAAARAMDAGPWSLALRYGRPAEDRIRFAVDPEGAIPEHWGEAERAALRAASRLGKPPADAALELDEHGVEVRAH